MVDDDDPKTFNQPRVKRQYFGSAYKISGYSLLPAADVDDAKLSCAHDTNVLLVR